MKKLIVLLLMILPLGAIAQEVKIAFVKTQEVFMAMPEVSGMEKQMADLNEKYRVELKQMQDEYQKKYSDFVAQQDSLTENIKLRRMQEIQDIQERMDNFVQVAQQDVQKKQQELLQPIQQTQYRLTGKLINDLERTGSIRRTCVIAQINVIITGHQLMDLIENRKSAIT